MQFLPLFPTLPSTADGEQQALYKATFPGAAERHNLSLVQAVGHQEAGSQAPDCSFNMCHAQYSINGKYNPFPCSLPFRPTSLTPLLSSHQQRKATRDTVATWHV